MSTLFVLVESFDSRSGGHDVKIHKIFKEKEEALVYMEIVAKKMAEEGDYLLEKGNDYFNLIYGEDYTVLQVLEGQV
tara:strand:- start:274 stop:504 length:231 start_codon:yes stop_codon:yes gene_type:complete